MFLKPVLQVLKTSLREGHYEPVRVWEGHRGHQIIENQLCQSVGVWIDQIFGDVIDRISTIGSCAGSDLQAISF